MGQISKIVKAGIVKAEGHQSAMIERTVFTVLLQMLRIQKEEYPTGALDLRPDVLHS